MISDKANIKLDFLRTIYILVLKKSLLKSLTIGADTKETDSSLDFISFTELIFQRQKVLGHKKLGF